MRAVAVLIVCAGIVWGTAECAGTTVVIVEGATGKEV
ncbi:MAG: hypothetical protein FD124_3722, partial [Alphaproteobacteria bacterium]